MVWGCITSEGVSELIGLPKSVTTDVYIKCLEDGLIKTLEKNNLNPKKVIFMQDNAPIHTSKASKEWLEMNKIKILDWPPQSPDLNPIENIWDLIDRRIRKRVKRPTNLEELWELIKREWNSITPEEIRSCYLSMVKRIKDLKNSKGSYTKY
jgi:transposase